MRENVTYCNNFCYWQLLFSCFQIQNMCRKKLAMGIRHHEVSLVHSMLIHSFIYCFPLLPLPHNCPHQSHGLTASSQGPGYHCKHKRIFNQDKNIKFHTGYIYLLVCTCFILGAFLIVYLTHWGRVTRICVNKLTIFGSDNGLSPGRRQTIMWTNVGIFLIGPLGTNFNEIIFIQENQFKMSCGKWHLICVGLNVLTVWLWGTGLTRKRIMSIIHSEVTAIYQIKTHWSPRTGNCLNMIIRGEKSGWKMEKSAS